MHRGRDQTCCHTARLYHAFCIRKTQPRTGQGPSYRCITDVGANGVNNIPAHAYVHTARESKAVGDEDGEL